MLELVSGRVSEENRLLLLGRRIKTFLRKDGDWENKKKSNQILEMHYEAKDILQTSFSPQALHLVDI
jgi:hypothetical protein